MKQFELQNNLLRLRVKKSSPILRGFLFFLAFAFFILPIFSLVISVTNGASLQISFVVFILIFGLFGFFLLRSALWNSFGEELIEFNLDELTYEANYGWFKDARKTLKMGAFNFSIRPSGYEEENLGMLVISGGELTIETMNNTQLDQLKSEGSIKTESVVKMPIDQLEELIELLDLKFRPDEVD